MESYSPPLKKIWSEGFTNGSSVVPSFDVASFRLKNGFASGLYMQASLEFSTRRHLSQSHKQLHTLQPCTLIFSFETCQGIKPIICTHRTREFQSMENVACSSNVDANISTSKLYEKDGILIVDHGSRRAQSNAMIHVFVDMFKLKTGHVNVEPAHMELASPTIKEAFDKCVCQGANRVIIAPYFLSPGRHWYKDIPALAAEAAKGHKNVSYIVTAPIGLHVLMVDILQDRINRCLSQATGETPKCDMCAGQGCQILDVSPEDQAEEDGANVDLDSQRKGKCVVLKTSTHQVRHHYA